MCLLCQYFQNKSKLPFGSFKNLIDNKISIYIVHHGYITGIFQKILFLFILTNTRSVISESVFGGNLEKFELMFKYILSPIL